MAYGIGIAILIFLGYCLAKIAKAILYAATSVSFIAAVIFLVFGWKLQKQV